MNLNIIKMTLGEFLEKIKDLPLNTEMDKWCPGSGYHHINLKIDFIESENRHIITF